MKPRNNSPRGLLYVRRFTQRYVRLSDGPGTWVCEPLYSLNTLAYCSMRRETVATVGQIVRFVVDDRAMYCDATPATRVFEVFYFHAQRALVKLLLLSCPTSAQVLTMKDSPARISMRHRSYRWRRGYKHPCHGWSKNHAPRSPVRISHPQHNVFKCYNEKGSTIYTLALRYPILPRGKSVGRNLLQRSAKSRSGLFCLFYVGRHTRHSLFSLFLVMLGHPQPRDIHAQNAKCLLSGHTRFHV